MKFRAQKSASKRDRKSPFGRIERFVKFRTIKIAVFNGAKCHEVFYMPNRTNLRLIMGAFLGARFNGMRYMPKMFIYCYARLKHMKRAIANICNSSCYSAIDLFL